MRHGLTGKNKTNAMKLLRFIAQPRVQALISNNNAAPVVKAAIQEAKTIYPAQNDFDRDLDNAFAKTGKPDTTRGTLPAGEHALLGHVLFLNSTASSDGRLAR